jgi:hypothetical protein
MKTFGEQFRESKGKPINYDGALVEMGYQREVARGTRVRVEFISANELIPQGITIKLDNGTVVVNGQEAKQMVLWRNTAPDVVDVELRPAKQIAVFKAWNVWRSKEGVTQAWTGNAGMIIDASENGATIRASSGAGNPSFDDLNFRITFLQS